MRSPDTEAPVVVATDGTAGPYIVVAPEHEDAVVRTLRARNIPLEIDQDAVLIDGKPALTVIHLDRAADVARVQQILDELSNNGASGGAGRAGRADDGPHELIVRAAPADLADLAEFIRRVETTPRGGWRRREDIEERLKTRRASGPSAYCLTKQFDEARRREIAVWLQKRGTRELYVSSLIPLAGTQQMDTATHNEALADFEETFVVASADGLRVQVLTYAASTEPKLEDLLSATTFCQLRSFCDAGGSKEHLGPAEIRRWAEFIARTHLDGAVVPPSLLARWLEKKGWPEEQRTRLVSEYELGRSLLSVYEEERAGP